MLTTECTDKEELLEIFNKPNDTMLAIICRRIIEFSIITNLDLRVVKTNKCTDYTLLEKMGRRERKDVLENYTHAPNDTILVIIYFSENLIILNPSKSHTLITCDVDQ
jgi:hypothetical protein